MLSEKANCPEPLSDSRINLCFRNFSENLTLCFLALLKTSEYYVADSDNYHDKS